MHLKCDGIETAVKLTSDTVRFKMVTVKECRTRESSQGWLFFCVLFNVEITLPLSQVSLVKWLGNYTHRVYRNHAPCGAGRRKSAKI